MRLSRAISALAGVLAIVAVPTAANAQNDYPPPPPVLTLSSTTINAGDSVTLSGRGYTPGEDVSVTSTHQAIAAGARGGAANSNSHAGPAMVTVAYHKPLADGPTTPPDPTPPVTIRSDTTGAFSVRLRFNDAGTERITATGTASALAASITLTVLPNGNLPVTGNNLARMSMIGGSLLVAGVALYLLTMLRRRRRGGPGAHHSEPGAPQPMG
jgi:hypothetical protein